MRLDDSFRGVVVGSGPKWSIFASRPAPSVCLSFLAAEAVS